MRIYLTVCIVNSLCAFTLLFASDERLMLQLSSGIIAERANAAYLLGMSDDPGATGLLLRQLGEESSNENMLVMIESLRKLKTKEGYSGLSVFYQNKLSPHVRRKVVQALGESGDPKYIELIAKSLSFPNPRDQQIGLSSLGRIKDPAATKVLFQYLIRQSVQHQKEWALSAIAAQKSKEAVKPLIHLGNQTKGSSERARIAETLAKIDDGQSQEAMFSWFQDAQDNTSKMRIARSLKGVGRSSIVGSLFKELNDNNLPVQLEVITAMVAIDKEAAKPYLESFYVREMQNLDPRMPRLTAMRSIRLHRHLRNILEINEDSSTFYPAEWIDDPILHHLIAS